MEKSFKQPDLKAPRFMKDTKHLLSTKLYMRFIKAHPEYKDITEKQFKDIIKTFNQKMYEGAIDNRDGIELPEALGYIFLGSCPSPKKKNINIGESRKQNKVILYNNLQSDNLLLKIFYTNYSTRYKLENKQMWMFKPIVKFRRKASEAYVENWPKYIMVDNMRKISSLFTKTQTKRFLAKDKHTIADYDEFNM